MSEAKIFNPLDKRHLGESVVQALEHEPAVPLATLAPFKGAGIYAIYYVGELPLYMSLAALNKPRARHPIYVGKAVAAGSRKGQIDVAGELSSALFKRLAEHRESLRDAKFNDTDFVCRYLALDDIWIGLGESLLIQAYSPLWNTLIEGFGNHDPGSGRKNMMRPAWDELHPGRAWAKRLKPAKIPRVELVLRVEDYLAALRPLA